MTKQFVISAFISAAIHEAEYEKLEDGTFGGRGPSCTGIVAFGPTLHECECQLQSTLEDWLLLGLKLGHRIPVVNGIDLNQEPKCEPVDSL